MSVFDEFFLRYFGRLIHHELLAMVVATEQFRNALYAALAKRLWQEKSHMCRLWHSTGNW